MKQLSLLLLTFFAISQTQAKVWRVNNNAGVVADFTSFYDAVQAATVAAGDTLYFEPSAADYATNSITLNKKLTMIGAGFMLDPNVSGYPANTGLQVGNNSARIPFFYMSAGASGTKFLGMDMNSGVYISGASNVTFERVFLGGSLYFQDGTCTNITVRKCFLNYLNVSAGANTTMSNFVFENNILNSAQLNLTVLTGSSNIVRNNSSWATGGWALRNTYFVNNIVATGNQCDLTDCTIKNNLFQAAQVLPNTATNNLVSQDMNAVFVSGSTGSVDSRFKLKAGSPAIGAGLTVGAVTSPDCGAFGATDPYRLSGIPNIPSIYSITVPTSIPSGTATMNVTFSSKNNN